MFKLYCNKNDAYFQETAILTSGRVGEQISFTFSPDWDGLLKTAVFIAGKESRDVVLTEDTCNIPPEVLVFPGEHLRVGVFGETSNKMLVIPTIYASAGTIRPGASPSGMPSTPPTPSWPEQVQAIATRAKEVADSVRSDADAGKFKGDTGMAGGWYTPAITQPDENTMRVAFTPSKEGMPAVDPADIAIPTGGGSGTSGEDGGYYTPEVTQTSENTMQVAFTPSKTSMPAVSGKEITLPAGQKGDKGDTGNAGADGKSAYAYAVEGGYTGTEAEFAAKLAQEKYANPEALTFTGAATGSYDGSQPLTVNIPSGAGGDNPWRLIKTVTLEETVKSITVDTDSDGNAFSLSEIYINTNVTNSEDQTVATSFSLKINGKYTHGIGTTAGMAVPGGKTGESGRNWIWLMSLNPLRALHGIWMATNTASGKTVQCYQANEFSDTNPNPHSVGEKITGIEIFGLSSTNYLAAGSEFRIYGR